MSWTSQLEPPTDENKEVFDDLTKEINRDLFAADLRLSIFIGASSHFKYESLLKPIPSAFKNCYNEVDIDRIRALVTKLPPLPSTELSSLDHDSVNLLKTVLLNGNYQLSSVTIGELKEQVTGLVDLRTAPQWVFRVDHSESRNQIWEQRKLSSSTFYAFHGSRFENFHSILNLGLHQHLNKTALFGEGIYLSTEQSLSLHYSPGGASWNKSQLGPELSILALCEVIDHPNVKRQTNSGASKSTVPEKYILVTNNELVRPRYLLVYASPKVPTAKLSSTFWERNKFIICLGFYVSLLIAIGWAKKVVP